MCERGSELDPHAPRITDGFGVTASELATGILNTVSVDQLPPGTRLVVQTANRDYVIIDTCGGLDAFLQGHPACCLEPVPVYVRGSGRRDPHGSRVLSSAECEWTSGIPLAASSLQPRACAGSCWCSRKRAAGGSGVTVLIVNWCWQMPNPGSPGGTPVLPILCQDVEDPSESVYG